MTQELTAYPITGAMTPEKKDGIFNSPDCRAMFEERVKGLRLEDSEAATKVSLAFDSVFLLIPRSQLNLSPEEFEQLCNTSGFGYLNAHTGIVLKMLQLIGHSQPKDYASSNAKYLEIANACETIKQEISDLINPLRDTCIEEFWSNATPAQIDDVKYRWMEAEKKATHPMPGNPAGMQQFNFNGQ